MGALAELSLLFMWAALGAGATAHEAITLTQAYIATFVQGKSTEGKEEGLE